MAELALALRAAALLALLLVSGWAAARVGSRRVDLFAAAWWGLAINSLTGVLLARAGWFSLLALGTVGGGVTVVALALGRGRVGAVPEASAVVVASRRVRLLACGAGLVACAWTWPPFECFMAGADSTMYLNAGIHLARTGSYEVPDTIAGLLSPALKRGLLVSVGLFDGGPFIRLPGGLLMSSREATAATPAFFPLLPVWTGALTAVGGPALAPAVAPLSVGLAVWALTLFAGETLGLASAIPTAGIFLGNFAVWWFGRQAMPEPLTSALVWGALVFLGRGAPFAAGAMLGVAGVARAETLVFAIAAVAWWAAWTPVGGRALVSLAVGAALAGILAAAGLVASPSHHLAYLANDLAFAWTKMTLRALPALWDGRLVAAIALLPMVPLIAYVGAWWSGGAVARKTIRVVFGLAILAAAVLYVHLGGRADPIRHLGWLAGSMSPLGLGLAAVGTVLLWSRGGPAARLAVVLVALVALVFVPSPRVGGYQPWAMRRFLPVVLPGLALAAGAVLGRLGQSPRRLLRALAVSLTVIVVGLQLRPVLAVRGAGYYTDSLANLGRLADLMPSNALVVVDSGFADHQIQVPLWLAFGRESFMTSGGWAAWRDLLPLLVASGRPVYWIQNRLAIPPQSKGLSFTPIAVESDIAIRLPDAPGDAPPAKVLRNLLPLRVYGVTTEKSSPG